MLGAIADIVVVIVVRQVAVCGDMKQNNLQAAECRHFCGNMFCRSKGVTNKQIADTHYSNSAASSKGSAMVATTCGFSQWPSR